jgi:hypothetical protein
VNATVRNVSFVVISSIAVCIVVFLFALRMYRSPKFVFPRIELVKQSLDTLSMNAYNENSAFAHAVNTYVYHNGDKYVFRPPQIAPVTQQVALRVAISS